MPGTWTAQEDIRLLLLAIDILGGTPSYDKLAQGMGPQYTRESVRQHLAKLRKSVPPVEGNRKAGVSRASKASSSASAGSKKGKGVKEESSWASDEKIIERNEEDEEMEKSDEEYCP
ncbi:hypothetical protein SAICODRAFT_7254 [Saitoella complicata NRRL Y-17804]|uniref:uncharacterized protein n=1 Tax=Saitoella complicata (strain BCRC 22490 / CBS 7301 / JCM 7358 / NBRC 10748 / NRRL Y-17804) TaxID=698492 RepID=UPI000866BFEF|nr:uncharacterized protein SAICODRAFT_7254 [Saitoella complicata NRRL Y-17804]ODQ53095.1 hypothetical protein SAICODRAFT_7254 [Saitoella complicata NRRL Y-17804]